MTEEVKAQKYKVERHGPEGIEVIYVTAASGDEAAQKAYKTGCVIRGIMPNNSDADEDSLAVERDEEASTNKKANAKPTAAALKAATDLEVKSDKDVADRKVAPYV